jgi:hypothetical protein
VAALGHSVDKEGFCYDWAGIQPEEAQQWVDLRAWPNLSRVFISWTII